MNVLKRVEIAKTTQPPKRGRNLDKKGKASQKRPRGMRNPQTINVDQTLVDVQLSVEKGHQKDVHHLGPRTSVHTNVGAGTSEHLDSIIEEITMSLKVLMRFPQTMLFQENHSIERLQMSIYFSPQRLQRT
jgi:hypothetical protein